MLVAYPFLVRTRFAENDTKHERLKAAIRAKRAPNAGGAPTGSRKLDPGVGQCNPRIHGPGPANGCPHRRTKRLCTKSSHNS